MYGETKEMPGRSRKSKMRSADDLERILAGIDGRGYKAYRDIRGSYRLEGMDLHVDHVQGDPFAAPSRLSVTVPVGRAGFPPSLYEGRSRRVALEDLITRVFDRAIRSRVKGRRGTGGSGRVEIDRPGQEIMERTSCFVTGDRVEVRFRVGLPARGRRVLGREAREVLLGEIPLVAGDAMLYRAHDPPSVERHVAVAEDQDSLREMLEESGLVAFIADGSVLPRRSGIDDRPLAPSPGRRVVEFRSPDSMKVSFDLPNAGRVEGMGIEEGITLIVGGGFHGKSTLLRAIERGVYNHIPGDGRELAVTRGDAVKIRAEDGRYVAGVDIRPFIDGLPHGESTESFTSVNASGSTSQAANIIEALEAGSRLLMLDEDTSATNFMIRDARMQGLVASGKEPITPFVDRVGQLGSDMGVSTIIVMGGSGDYFDVADRVVMMDSYVPADVTSRAAEIASERATGREREGSGPFGRVTERVPRGGSFDPSRGRRQVKIDAKGLRRILFGRLEIDLEALEQLVDVSQTRALGSLINYCAGIFSGGDATLAEAVWKAFEDIGERGMDAVLGGKRGDFALPRAYELAAAINRMRTLEVDQRTGGT